MSRTPPADPNAPPGQTIVLERRERSGCLRRLFWPVLLVSLLFNANQIAKNAANPASDGLNERYVAGSVLPTDDKVAIVRVSGPIALGSVDYAVKQLRRARRDEKVKAVVLRVDSPGGTVTGSDQIWREVALVKREGKPVVASMGGIAASGGYYVSAPADLIIAEPTTTTGSIGVILELPNASGLLEKVGVDFHAVTAGEWKDMGSPFEPFDERELARFQELVDLTYRRFLRIVADGRDLTLDRARDVSEGQIFDAEEALANGLVDRIGYLEDALLEAARRAGLDEPRVVQYNKPPTLADALIGVSSRGSGPAIDEEAIMRLRTPRMMMIMR